MNNKIYYNVEIVPKSKRKIIETEQKAIPLTHINMMAHFTDFSYQYLQLHRSNIRERPYILILFNNKSLKVNIILWRSFFLDRNIGYELIRMEEMF